MGRSLDLGEIRMVNKAQQSWEENVSAGFEIQFVIFGEKNIFGTGLYKLNVLSLKVETNLYFRALVWKDMAQNPSIEVYYS